MLSSSCCLSGIGGYHVAGDLARQVVHGNQWRLLMAADGLAQGAAGIEGAARRDVGEGRHHPGNLVQSGPGLQAAGQGLDQTLGVGMAWIRHDAVRGSGFDDFAGIHDGHLFRHLGDHPQVVGDQDQAGSLGFAQLLQKIHDFGLDGDVQGRGGFVGDDDRRIGEQGDGDDDALAHAARELVRILGQALFRRRNLDFSQFLQCDGFGLGAREAAMGQEGFHHLGADGQHRVEGHHGVLKDHADAVSPDITHLLGGERGEIPVVEHHASPRDKARFADQVDDGESGDRFAGPAFAHQPHAFALIEAEADAVDGGQVAEAQAELDFQVDDFQ
ncbi:putative peptide transport system ATP-binding protein [Desulfosarcina cetonica]|nr:putative peptide transport system ATP-binding protein [Desulfosarcina cetonica]